MDMLTLTEQLRHKPFPEVAQAIRDRSDAILKRWHALVLDALPHVDEITIEAFEDDIAAILSLVADSLETDDEQAVSAVLDQAPKHGLDRFLQRYGLTDLLTENRILRGVMLTTLEDALGRRIKAQEAASVHAILDVMFHQGTLALVHQQKDQLREAVEAELKFLSFFSHDLSNNLLIISSRLEATMQQIEQVAELADTAGMLRAAHETIQRTRNGMQRLLRHEQMRKARPPRRTARISLRRLIETIAEPLKPEAAERGIDLRIEVDRDWQLDTDPDLLNLVLQNLIHNAINHSRRGTVRISVACEEGDGRAPGSDQPGHNGRCRISVSDEGPGIDETNLRNIFEAFERGEALGAPGVGLGLAIVSQAASLLDATIDVETQPGRGSTFHIILQGELIAAGDARS